MLVCCDFSVVGCLNFLSVLATQDGICTLTWTLSQAQSNVKLQQLCPFVFEDIPQDSRSVFFKCKMSSSELYWITKSLFTQRAKTVFLVICLNNPFDNDNDNDIGMYRFFSNLVTEILQARIVTCFKSYIPFLILQYMNPSVCTLAYKSYNSKNSVEKCFEFI